MRSFPNLHGTKYLGHSASSHQSALIPSIITYDVFDSEYNFSLSPICLYQIYFLLYFGLNFNVYLRLALNKEEHI